MGKLRDLVTGVLALNPAGDAIEFEHTWTTWGNLAQGMAQLGRILGSHGLDEGARIGVMMRNRPPLLAAMLEIVTSERCLVTINPVYPDDKACADIAKSACPAIVAMANDWGRSSLAAAARESGALLIEACCNPDGAVDFVEMAGPNRASWEKALASGVAIEMLTSGTTGTPKRIPLSAGAFERSMLDYTLYEKGREDLLPKLRSGVQLLTSPLAHIGGIGAAMNTIMAGRKGALLEKFTVANFHDLVVRHRPKVAGGPPTVLRMLLDAKIPKEDLASLTVFRTGTAPLDPALAEEFTATYGISVLQNYGATEFAGGVAGWTNADHEKYGKEKSGSVGRLNPGVEGRIVDPDTFAVLKPGDAGILELRAKHLGDGRSWIRTTDLAVLDPDGFLFIRGRADNAINRGGYKISPDDVVRALVAHPTVAAASVVGVDDARLGQVPVAALVAKSGTQPTSDRDLKDFLRETLSSYQIPVQYRWVEELPLTDSLKVDQVAVRAIFQTDKRLALGLSK